MSFYESMTGNGMVRQEEIKKLQSMLARENNLLVIRYGINDGAQFASRNTAKFPFMYWNPQIPGGGGFFHCGEAILDLKEGTFEFNVASNNYAMEDARKSPTFNALMDFIETIDEKPPFGARTFYEGEGTEEIKEYGSWKTKALI